MDEVDSRPEYLVPDNKEKVQQSGRERRARREQRQISQIKGLSKASKNINSEQEFKAELENPYLLDDDVPFEFENAYIDFVEDLKLTKEALSKVRLRRMKIENEEQAARKYRFDRRMKAERGSEHPSIRRCKLIHQSEQKEHKDQKEQKE